MYIIPIMSTLYDLNESAILNLYFVVKSDLIKIHEIFKRLIFNLYLALGGT